MHVGTSSRRTSARWLALLAIMSSACGAEDSGNDEEGLCTVDCGGAGGAGGSGGGGAGGSSGAAGTSPMAGSGGTGGVAAGQGGASGMGGASGSAGTSAGVGGGGAGGMMPGGMGGSGGMSGGDGGTGGAPPPGEHGCTPAPAGTFPTTTEMGGPGGNYTIVRPTTLGEGGFKHPPVAWGNGLATVPSNYVELLDNMASNGFVVIANPGTGSDPMVVRQGLEWLLEQNDAGGQFAGMLAVDCAGATSDALGGGTSLG